MNSAGGQAVANTEVCTGAMVASKKPGQRTSGQVNDGKSDEEADTIMDEVCLGAMIWRTLCLCLLVPPRE